MTALRQLFLNDQGYAVLVLATAVTGSWRATVPVLCCTWALVVSWATSRLLVGRVTLEELAEIYATMHAGLLVLVSVLLVIDGALWLAIMAGAAAVQLGVHLEALLSPDAAARRVAPGYDVAIALLFTAQLACVWLARTRVGCWWPEGWRDPDLTVDEGEDNAAAAEPCCTLSKPAGSGCHARPGANHLVARRSR